MSSSDLIKDLFTGCCSGWGQVLTMMPFENIKVNILSFRLKLSPDPISIRDILMLSRRLLRNKVMQDSIRACLCHY